MIHALTFAAYAVTLDGKTVLPHARAAVADGHVLLPVRALGEALGADVGYDGRAHTITVQRGTHVATISARGAVRVLNGSAYAPLRTAATAFGLGIAYDARTRTVALDGGSARSAHAVRPDSTKRANVPPSDSVPARAPFAVAQTPSNGAQVHDPYPSISVRFAGAAGIDPRSLRVLLDGRDVSAEAAVVGDQVLLTPRRALPAGEHSVAVTARDAGSGASLASSWTFADDFAFATAPAPTPFPVSAIWIDRWILPGTNAFDVYVNGAPGMVGYVGVDGVGGFFPMRVYSANSYVAHVVVPNGVNQPFARVAARITLPNGQTQTIVLPQQINLVTPPIVMPPAPVPAPSATPHPWRRVLIDSPPPSARPTTRPMVRATPAPAPAVPTASPMPAPGATPAPTTPPSRLRRILNRRPTPAPSAAP